MRSDPLCRALIFKGNDNKVEPADEALLRPAEATRQIVEPSTPTIPINGIGFFHMLGVRKYSILIRLAHDLQQAILLAVDLIIFLPACYGKKQRTST
jgi:hypothetical protein